MSPARPVAKTEQLDALGVSLKTLLTSSRRLRGRETHMQGQLSYAQYRLLFGLDGVEEQSSTELARNAELSGATVTQMLDALEADGLVVRRRSETDRRVVLTALTASGAQVIAARRAQIEPRWRAALEDFDDEQLLAASAVMERIAGFFDTLHDEDL